MKVGVYGRFYSPFSLKIDALKYPYTWKLPESVSLKILFVHNKYGATSGEEIMLQKIIDLLRYQGHEVHTFFKNSSDIPNMRLGKIRSFLNGIYSPGSRCKIREILKNFQPDLVQIQNLYPLISPSILPVIESLRIPIVMRLSNYRLICPNGLFLCKGRVCERCRNGKEFWCLLQNCEENLLKSMGYATRNWVARKMRFYLDNVTFYYAQTSFQKSCLIDEGFDSDRIAVIPNMVDGDVEENEDFSGDYIAYAGRVSPEKGAATLVRAAGKCRDISFKLAGNHKRMPDIVSSATGNVEFLGHLSKEALENVYKKCRIFVMPSIWYEGFPGVLIEAMLQAKPVICSRIGGLPEIVEDGKTGLIFEPGNAEDFAKKINYLYERPELCKKMGVAGKEKVIKEYSPQIYYQRLMNVYNQARSLV